MTSSYGSGRSSMGLRSYQRAIVFGHPPKFIWLRVGNCQTGLIMNLLRSRYHVIRQFIESETESLLVLERPQT
jgi:predicted nuclease of predicted toxin-antitoxin system